MPRPAPSCSLVAAWLYRPQHQQEPAPSSNHLHAGWLPQAQLRGPGPCSGSGLRARCLSPVCWLAWQPPPQPELALGFPGSWPPRGGQPGVSRGQAPGAPPQAEPSCPAEPVSPDLPPPPHRRPLAQPRHYLSMSLQARGAQKAGPAAWPGPLQPGGLRQDPVSRSSAQLLPPPGQTTSDDAASAPRASGRHPPHWLAADAPVVGPATARRPSRVCGRVLFLPSRAPGPVCAPHLEPAPMWVSQPRLCTQRHLETGSSPRPAPGSGSGLCGLVSHCGCRQSRPGGADAGGRRACSVRPAGPPRSAGRHCPGPQGRPPTPG